MSFTRRHFVHIVSTLQLVVYLYRVGGGDGDSETSHADCGDGSPICVCCEEDSAEESERGSETQNRMESDPWDPTEPGYRTVHSDWIKDNIY